MTVLTCNAVDIINKFGMNRINVSREIKIRWNQMENLVRNPSAIDVFIGAIIKLENPTDTSGTFPVLKSDLRE